MTNVYINPCHFNQKYDFPALSEKHCVPAVRRRASRAYERARKKSVAATPLGDLASSVPQEEYFMFYGAGVVVDGGRGRGVGRGGNFRRREKKKEETKRKRER